MQRKNKVFVTGGTSRLGREMVERFLEAGAQVYFTYFRQDAAAQEFISKGAVGFSVDLSKTKEIDELAAKLKEKTKVLDILIHNAAAVRDHTIQNLTEEEWDYVLNVDLKAPYYLTKKLLPLLFKAVSKKESAPSPLPSPPWGRGEGEGERAIAKIFFITSRAAITGGIGISNYAAAKAGVIGLAKSLAQELGKKNILVNAVNPGFMESRMTKDIPEEAKQRQVALSPLGKISNPAEVADFLVYLSSDLMSQATGQVFHFESRQTL